MRQRDLERLRRPYAESDPDQDRRFARALNIEAPSILSLHSEVLNDFDDRVFGVGWWAPHPGASRRILISDHLVQCIHSVQKNLTEARLHFLEVAEFWERESDLFADAIRIERQRIMVVAPPRPTAWDDLPEAMSDLHTAGFFRAIAGALDCLGAAIVGIAALPINILRADLREARRAFNRIPATGDGPQLQRALAQGIEAAEAAAGPNGWLSWTTDFRNMLIHRGRRLQLWQLRPKSTVIYDFQGRRILRSEAIQQLPADPGRSDIEVLVADRSPVLTEEAPRTLEGVLVSAREFIEATAVILLDGWRQRRTNPEILQQPREQWPDGSSSESTGFMGYAPGTLPYDPRLFHSHVTLAQRMRAAALDDSQRPAWATFD
jgi:hypothetical protein